MTVGAMLREMSQRELCHWIAYFRIENEHYDKSSSEEAKPESERPKIAVKQAKQEYTQEQKDGALLSQLFALAARDDFE